MRSSLLVLPLLCGVGLAAPSKAQLLHNEELGITTELPVGFTKQDPPSTPGIAIVKSATGSFGVIALARTRPTPESLADAFKTFEDRHNENGKVVGITLKQEEDAKIQTPLGPALVRGWTEVGANSTGTHFRNLLIPFCDGEATLTVAFGWSKSEERAPLDLWLKHTKRSGKASACEAPKK